MKKNYSGLFSKILVPVIVITSLLVIITQTISIYEFRQAVNQAGDREINATARNLRYELEIMREMLISQMLSLAENDHIAEAYLQGDRQTCYRICTDFQKELKQSADFFTIIDSEKKTFMRTTNLEKFGDAMESLQSIHDAFQGRNACYFELTSANPISMRCAVPMRDKDGKIIGVMTGGYRLYETKWVDHLKSLFEADFTVFLGEKRISTTLINPQTGERAIGTMLNNEKIRSRVFDKKESYPGTGESNHAMVLGTEMRVCYLPMSGPDGKTIGMIFSGISMDEQVQRITDNIWANVIVTLLGLGGFSLFLVSLVSRILKPLQEMTIAAERLSQGATDFELQVRTKDELEVLANAFNEVGRSIQEKKKVAQEIAKNNLKIWVPLRSEEDELGVALIQMRQGIYESISELTQYSELMYQESDNLSAINETLASGASESAAALEDITNAVKTLNERNRKNTESAREAEQLTTGAKEEANQGSQKMTKMVDSMDTITKGSDEIKKIIRVIDDIAFQTNLLALNAAVEAARAGTHGKGFAVVAEEVRNLASRSAKAAQETAELIEESIRQVTSGNQIAEDTSHSLNTITQNVLTITETIGHIAGESERQTMEISSITTAVSQASVAAHETMHKMTDAAETMKSIANTAEKLDAITKRFQFNPDGSTDAPFEAKHIIGSTHKRRNV